MAPPLPAEMLYSGEEEKHANDEVVYICHYRGSLKGTLYLTNFRLIFMGASSESFIVLPLGMIEKIEKIGGHSNKGEHKYGLEITCRDLRSLFFAHPRDNHSRRPVYELISKLAFPYTTESLVYAFKYNGRRDSAYRQGDEVTEGWQLFSMRKEFERMGVNPSQWRVSDINKDYRLCPTYPSELILPCATPDADIQAVAKFRSKGRLPALVWMHPMTQATITRCSQPRVGVTRKRCPQDEAYLETIRGLGGADDPLFIMDARPRRNARANQAKGLGYESTANYPNCIMTFLNIHNIHVMRESLRKMRELVWPKPDEAHWYQRLEATGWLKHSKTILAAAVAIVDKVTRGKSVLIHCSDGWDRTAQLASLSLLMMDPYYRTVEGFMVLIEKEWLAYGHKFAQRLGLGDRNAADDQMHVWHISVQHRTRAYRSTPEDAHLVGLGSHLEQQGQVHQPALLGKDPEAYPDRRCQHATAQSLARVLLALVFGIPDSREYGRKAQGTAGDAAAAAGKDCKHASRAAATTRRGSSTIVRGGPRSRR
eukprot:TRINITY_DN11408_c0_g1_i4.p1 TRINITY_DN11408_c0_g1~~TRINITY_DN11408_c0_g1_i4.p1  ORF type:complete len:539 (+),score=70.23 TRINITY_DN11408_c0_g1_i4:2-1618(+)